MVCYRRFFFIFLFTCTLLKVQAQIDSLPYSPKNEAVDAIPIPDSNNLQASATLPMQFSYSTTYAGINMHPYLPLAAPPIEMYINYKEHNAKDALFYIIVAMTFLLAMIKVLFPKYFKNLFLLFFQTSLRQKQTRDQLAQEWVAGLLINLLFISSTGFFITLFIQYKQWSSLAFPLLGIYICGLLVLIYLGKSLFIQFIGWVFNSRNAASGYLFQVFMVNRILGVVLLPLGIILAFSQTQLAAIVITIAMVLGFILFFYRYLISFSLLKQDLQLNAFHFLLYLCGVEILPMVVIYKLLVDNIG